MKKLKEICSVFVFILLIVNNLTAQEIKSKQIDILMKRAYQLGVFNGNVLVI